MKEDDLASTDRLPTLVAGSDCRTQLLIIKYLSDGERLQLAVFEGGHVPN
jgi:hypothetical protein